MINLHAATRALPVVALGMLFAPAPAFGQALPNQISVGVGVVRDRQPPQSASSFVFSLAFADSGNEYWPSRFGFVFEAEVGPTSELDPCRSDGSSSDPPNCGDAAILGGLRFHVLRRPGHPVLPFVNVLLGSYWKGSGVEDPDFLSSHFAVQGGGGVDLRLKNSPHVVRLSLDYRHVVATGANRNQLRFLTSYVFSP